MWSLWSPPAYMSYIRVGCLSWSSFFGLLVIWKLCNTDSVHVPGWQMFTSPSLKACVALSPSLCWCVLFNKSEANVPIWGVCHKLCVRGVDTVVKSHLFNTGRLQMSKTCLFLCQKNTYTLWDFFAGNTSSSITASKENPVCISITCKGCEEKGSSSNWLSGD